MTPWIMNSMMAFQGALVLGFACQRSWGWAIFWAGCLIANFGLKIVGGGK